MTYTLYKDGQVPFVTEYAIMVDRKLGQGWSLTPKECMVHSQKITEVLPEDKKENNFNKIFKKRGRPFSNKNINNSSPENKLVTL